MRLKILREEALQEVNRLVNCGYETLLNIEVPLDDKITQAGSKESIKFNNDEITEWRKIHSDWFQSTWMSISNIFQDDIISLQWEHLELPTKYDIPRPCFDNLKDEFEIDGENCDFPKADYFHFSQKDFYNDLSRTIENLKFEIKFLMNIYDKLVKIPEEITFDYKNKSQTNTDLEKIDLYWDEKNKLFKVNKIFIDISKSTHQFDALRILFEEQPLKNDLSFKEIYDLLDHSRSLDLHKATKRYSNATNQLNNKIQKITGIESMFKTTRQLVRFNHKYNFHFQIIS